MNSKQYDVFICHASEDKKDIVRPLVNALENENILCWFDEKEIEWGDSLTGKINKGLSESKFVLVVLSENSVNKNWPQKELNTALNREISHGEVRVLPLLIGSKEFQETLLDNTPFLQEKKYLTWNNDTSEIVTALKIKLRSKHDYKESPQKHSIDKSNIIIPRINREYNDQDKAEFIKTSFQYISDYFKVALNELESVYDFIKTDFEKITNTKFIVTIYKNGKLQNKCKTWISSMFSENMIAYSEGQILSDSDNSMNDWISLKIEDGTIGFIVSEISFFHSDPRFNVLMNVQTACDYLWLKFMKSFNNK